MKKMSAMVLRGLHLNKNQSMFKHPSAVEVLESRIAPAKVFAVNSNNQLLSFDAYDSEQFSSPIAITGLASGENILGIDFNPSDGLLYALGSASHLYIINTISGAASLVGSGLGITLSGQHFGFDINPVEDIAQDSDAGLIRVISDTGQNFRINPATGLSIDTDTLLPGRQPDASLTVNADFGAAAYSYFGFETNITRLYVIDKFSGKLYIQEGFDDNDNYLDPNTGTITDIYNRNLGVNPIGSIGFDMGRVYGFGTALASMQVNGLTGLYNINVAKGTANFIGLIGTGTVEIIDIAISPEEIAGNVTIVNSKTATYTDTDGDKVTVTISKGALSASMFNLRKEGPNNGSILQTLDLTLNPDIAGAKVTISAKSSSLGGDGFVNVGYIDATDIDLGAVKVDGDLARINAGDGVTKRVSITSLDIVSLGAMGYSTQSVQEELNPDALSSYLLGGVAKISIRGSVDKSSIFVSGGLDAKIGSVNILGDLRGGSVSYSGAITANDSSIGSIIIGGGIFGSSGEGSGSIFAGNEIKSIKVNGSLNGGSGDFSGNIQGDIIGNVTINGSLFGSDGLLSGAIRGEDSLNSATVNGSLLGGSGHYSGSIYADRQLVKATVKGDLFGGLGLLSGSIAAENLPVNNNNGGAITKSITVGGSVYAFAEGFTGIILQGSTGSVKIGGSVVGYNGATVSLWFTGFPFISPPSSPAKTLAIGKLIIGGDVKNADILTGFDGGGDARSDASIGSITVGGSVIATNIVAAISKGVDGIWGTIDDTTISPSNSSFIPTIGSITIKGQLLGSYGFEDGFVITAGEIKSIKVGNNKIALGASVLDELTAYGATRDINIREVASLIA
jgi:hypothetical protein